MGRTVDSAAYLQAVIHEWRVVKPDGVPLRAVYTLLQARERPRERPREGQDAPTRDLEALPEERAAAAGVLRKVIDKRKRGKRRAEPRPSDDGEESRAARPTEEAPKPPPPPVPLHEALGQALHMVLVGEPGAGKSVTLQYLGLVYACAARVSWRAADPPEPCGQGVFTPPPLGLADEPLRIPFLIRLTDDTLLTSLSDPKTRASALELHMLALWHEMGGDPALTLDDLRGWREQGRLLVLLDGLDEVDAAQRARVREVIRRFRLRAEACRIVVATRPAGYHPPLPDFQDFTLQPLNEATAPHFLRQWMAARVERPPDDPALLRQAEAIWAHIQTQPGLRRLAATPLTLKMLAEVAAEGGLEAVRNRADLYQRAAEKAYWRRARDDRGVPSDKKAWVLALVEAWAWARHAWGWRTEEEMRQAWATMTWTPPDAKATEPLVPPGDEARWEQARDWTRKYMLLKHGDEWAFWHQTWQEYFASRYLKQAWDRAAARAWPGLKPRLHHPAWQEVLYLLAAGMEDATPLVRRIRTARSPYERELLRDRALAARPVGDGARVAEDEVQRLLGELKKPLARWRQRAYWIGYATPFLLLLIFGLLWPWRHWPWWGALLANLIWLLVFVVGWIKLWLFSLLFESGANVFLPRLQSWLSWPWRRIALPISSWRVQAVRALAALGPRAIPVLERALKDTDRRVRRAAAEALGAIGPAAADAMSALAQALREWDRWVREAAAEALEKIGPAAVPALERALEDANWEVRWAAAEALGAIGPAAANTVPALVRALGDGDEDARKAAAKALGAIGPAAAEAVPALVQALGDEDGEVRRAAIEALGKIRTADAVPTLVRALEDANWEVRQAAARALGAIGPAAAEAVSALMQALGDAEGRVRAAAAADAVSALVQALEDTTQGGRTVSFTDDESLEDFFDIVIVIDEVVEVRWAAAEALGAIGPAAVPALERALEDADWRVREAAAEALGAIGPAAAEAVPDLVRALGDVNREVRWAAARALGAIGPAAVPALERALEDTNWEVRWAAAEALGAIGPAAVPALERALRDEDRWVREAAAEALEKIGPAAVPALERALEDANWEVREAAAEALGAIGPAAADVVPALVRALGDVDEDMRRAAAEALGAIGPAAADVVPALAQALGDSDWQVREAAAEALGKIGPAAAEAVPALVRALRDASWRVREAAARALGNIAEGLDDLARARKVARALWWRLTDWSSGVREAAYEALGAVVARLTQLEVAQLEQEERWDPLQPQPMPRWRQVVRWLAYGLAAVSLLAAGSTLLLLAEPIRDAVTQRLLPWVQGLSTGLLLGLALTFSLLGGGLAALARKLWQKASERSVGSGEK